MPIKLKCSCGHALNVPDALAGKTGKCPKCQAAIKIPSLTSGAATTAASPVSARSSAGQPKPGQPKPGQSAASQPNSGKPAIGKPAASQPNSGKPTNRPIAAPGHMDSFFDDVGLKKKSGPICPKCSGATTPNAALCTHCGFNMQTGEQVVGFQARFEKEEFNNPFLQEAADNMRRDVLIGERQDKAGTPWWMITSFLLGALCIAAAGVVIVDANVNEPAPASTLLGNVQRQSFGVVIGVTFVAMGIMIGSFANLSIIIYAFKESIGRGFAAWLLPFYSFVYGCMRWSDNKSGIIGLIVGGIVAGLGVALVISSGGIVMYQ